MSKKIITYTVNPALDVHSVTDKIEPDVKIRCDKPKRDPGGGGINVSRALKRLGMNSTAVYTRGGMIGDVYQQLVSEIGFDQIAVAIEAITRENISVQELESNEMYRFVLPGAQLKKKEWQELLAKVDGFSGADYLIASGSLPPGVPDDFYSRLSDKAKKFGIRFILDTSNKPLQRILDSGAYLIKPNEKELSQLVGKPLKNEDEQLSAAESIVRDYEIEIVVVSLGPDGAILATRDGATKLPSPRIDKKESAVGAGDSMVAGIVYSLVRSEGIENAVRYGLACGSAALMTPGTELVHKKDADQLFLQLQNVEVG